MRKYSALVIGILFLIYGGIRLGVSSILLFQVFGFIELEALKEPLTEIAQFMKDKASGSIIPFSATGYLVYLWIMGVALTAGAVGCIREQSHGLRFIGAFLILYVLLFANFQIVNAKIIHLVVCVILFLILWKLGHQERAIGGNGESR